MFTKKDNKPTIEDEYNKLVKMLSETEPLSDEYEKLVTHIEHINQLRSKKLTPVSGDVVASVIAGVLNTIIVLNFERFGVITSKAFGKWNGTR